MWTTALRCLISGQHEGVLDMVYSDFLTGYQNSDHIEPITQYRRAMSIHPNAGAPTEFPSLSVVDRLDRVSERLATSRLHFDEGDFISTLHDEVDIPMAASEAVRKEFPTVAPHPTRRDPFAQQP